MTVQQPVTFGRRGPAGTAPRRTVPAPHASPRSRPDALGESVPGLTYGSLLRDGGHEDADESYMRRFVGPNWTDFEGLWRSMRADGTLLPSFSGAAFSFSIVWLFYRRLYGAGVAAVALEVAIMRLSPTSSTILDLLLCLGIGAFGKALVISKGLRTIDAVERENLSRDEATARIERLGGVRLAEALAVSILLVGFGAVGLMRLLSSGMAADGLVPTQGLQELIKVL